MHKTIADIFNRNKAALAPLAGVTDSVYRRICAEFGAAPVMTEMISSDGYVRGRSGDKTARLLRFKDTERPIGIQFFGSDADIMTEAAKKVQDVRPDFIDINAGCPVRKVISKGSGSALLRTPDQLRRIVENVVGASIVPVTVKIRSGWDHETINAVEVARLCEDAGAQGIIVHPRTRSQGFGGESDWRIIAYIKEAVSVPVIG
ncbi:MAG: tRNA-dihydrouridine synthase, partial [Candidatus Latescibacteria bacterium]|nr:tRNA-dihydrouridine synthase [Candidatus Latescibacterota bacterium]